MVTAILHNPFRSKLMLFTKYEEAALRCCNSVKYLAKHYYLRTTGDVFVTESSGLNAKVTMNRFLEYNGSLLSLHCAI